MDKKFTYKFQVRGYELDSFGHVNNSVYLNYLEQARWEIVQKLGLLEIFKEEKIFLVVIEANIRYINELNIFDNAIAVTEMHRKGFFIAFKQNIVDENSKKIAKTTIKGLFVNDKREPVDIPKIILPYLHEPILNK